MSTGKPPPWVVLRAHFRADPRKTIVLAVLALVMVLIYGRMFLKPRGPRSASASAVTMVSDTDEFVAASDPAPKTAGPGRDRVALPGSWSGELPRNPFTIPTDAGGDGSSGVAESVGLAESSVENNNRREAGELVLQSTICGDEPVACISGQVIRPGDSIQGFVLESVHPMGVILRRGDTRVSLTLN